MLAQGETNAARTMDGGELRTPDALSSETDINTHVDGASRASFVHRTVRGGQALASNLQVVFAYYFACA